MISKDSKIGEKKFLIDGEEYYFCAGYIAKRVDEYDQFDWEDAWTTTYESYRIEHKNKYTGVLAFKKAVNCLIEYIHTYNPPYFSYGVYDNVSCEGVLKYVSKIIEKHGYTCYQNSNYTFRFVKNN